MVLFTVTAHVFLQKETQAVGRKTGGLFCSACCTLGAACRKGDVFFTDSNGAASWEGHFRLRGGMGRGKREG